MRALLYGIMTCAVFALDRDQCTAPRVGAGLKSSNALKSGNTLHVKKTKQLKEKTLVKKTHKFNGVTVFDSQLVEENDKGKIKIESQLVDVPAGMNTVPVHTSEEAAAACMAANDFTVGEGASRKRELLVKFDEDSCEFKLTHFVSNFIKGRSARPACFVEDSTLTILKTWDDLQHVLVPAKGGNQHHSWDFYGPGATPDPSTTVRTSLPMLDVAALADGSCSLTNSVTETWSCVHKEIRSGGSLVIVPNCTTDGFNYSDIKINPTHVNAVESNGAINVEADAHAFATATFGMYQAYTGGPPLPFKLISKVHYGYGYDNAFYDNGVMYFGDGATDFYPLVCLDVMAHEVSHGYTEQNSGLIYTGESGGMNEAFSDMAGETAEYFFYGVNNWLLGSDIIKSVDEDAALRYMSDPPRDGSSIDRVYKFSSTMDVHFSSGIYNKAFYNLATNPRWDTKLAFQAFQVANDVYWTAGSTFQAGTQGVYAAAQNLGFNAEDVQKAFAPTGLAVPPFISTVLLSQAGISIASRAKTSRTVTIGVNEFVRITTTGGSGDPDVYASLISNPIIDIGTGACSSCIARGYKTGNEDVTAGGYPTSQVVYVIVAAYTAVSNMGLTVQLNALPNFLSRSGMHCISSEECASNDCSSGICVGPASEQPTSAPSLPASDQPTRAPSKPGSDQPTRAPSKIPTLKPTTQPTRTPTPKPTKRSG